MSTFLHYIFFPETVCCCRKTLSVCSSFAKKSKGYNTFTYDSDNTCERGYGTCVADDSDSGREVYTSHLVSKSPTRTAIFFYVLAF